MAWVQIVNQIDQLTDDGRNGHSHQRAGNRHGFKKLGFESFIMQSSLFGQESA